ncbi:hypothetical protein ACFWR4_07860 [Streptomyces hydrogenans]|uniref:hypothetical protein n=1 Tax=Streptomyces hydrogenans TaxID=1873719 RepID=UPI003661858C
MLHEYEMYNNERRRHIPSALWPFFAPDPEKYYRWRVQLDCACITELFTWGNETPPSESRWLDGREALPPGQLRCEHDDGPSPYREIIAWHDRREIPLPADPVDPPKWADPDVWALLRHDEPRASAFWKVTLECGHVEDSMLTDLDWKPDDGPSLADSARVSQMTEEFEALWASHPDFQPDRDLEHTRRMLAAGWPLPRPETECYTCPHVRQIVAYQRVGWLVPREAKQQTEPTPQGRNSRAALERRLRRLEVDAEHLRGRLSEWDDVRDV